MSAAVLLPRETRNEPFGISKWLFAQHGLLLVECGFGALFGNAPTGVGRASVVRYGSRSMAWWGGQADAVRESSAWSWGGAQGDQVVPGGQSEQFTCLFAAMRCMRAAATAWRRSSFRSGRV